MARSITQEERQLLKLVEKLHVPDEEKSAWAERIRNGDMSRDLAEEIRQRLSTPPEGEQESDQAAAHRAQSLAELAVMVKRWQLSSQARNFGRR